MAVPYATLPVGTLKKPEPFKVEIPQKKVDELQQLLKLSRVPQPTYETLQEDGRYGVTHKWIVEAKKAWEGFDWRKSEEHMNSFPNFMSTVSVGNSSFKIHFVALFSTNPSAIPVGLFHGWPGNFLEFLPILNLMKQKYTPSTLPYHLIVPSLPGYAFSSPPPLDRDFSLKDIGEIMNQLMLDLGFGSGYVAQGGDIGSRVAKTLGCSYDACKAVHVNFLPVLTPPEGMSVEELNERDREGLKRGQDFMDKGAAYSIEHATRPGTIGLVLDSSPVALLAWIGEKFLSWTDKDPSLETILESVTLYWFTESMGRGIYPYRGRYNPQPWPGAAYLDKPMGYSNFPKELLPTPKTWVATDGNLVFYREHEKGGHFAALELPEVLMADIEDFVKQVWVK